MDKHVRVTAIALIAGMVSACAMGQQNSEAAMSGHDRKKETNRLTLESQPNAVSEVGASAPRSSAIGPGLQRLADTAKSDLVARFNLADDAIEIVEAAYVTWPDSSIGCAKPGYQYMQVLTHGARIVFKAGGRLYHYHSGNNRPPSYCERPTVKNPPPYAPGEA